MRAVPTSALVLAPALALALSWATGCTTALLPSPPGVVRYDLSRLDVPYDEPFAREKRLLFDRINEDRAANGVPPVAYATLNARVGDTFCLDAARSGSVGHWDTRGRAPYLRWTLGGGVDYHAQNFGSRTRIGGPLDEPVAELILEPHVAMMAEVPPDDGHRRTILEPSFTHVGIGVAREGSEFRMTEEFCRQVVEWVEVPSRPLRPYEIAQVRLKVPAGYGLSAIEVFHEPHPEPLSLREIARRGSYSLPPSVRKLLPRLSGGVTYTDGDRGDFGMDWSGIADVRIPSTSGRGSYYLVAYVEKGSVTNRPARPATLIRLEVE